MRLPHRLVISLLALALLTLGVGSGRASADDPPQDPLARTCELGITLALSGSDAAAESVFVTLLSRAPRDARALNNLGNLHLWRGDADLALAFYARAGEADSADAGIVLNEATALMIAGEDDAARGRANEGVRRAGGPDEAARLLGLHFAKADANESRGSDRVQVSRDEVLALLRAATRAVPADSTNAAAAGARGAGAKPRKPVPAWRSAGARGASDTDVSAVVYWKR
jgi:Flp pilus assembly protein TadD